MTAASEDHRCAALWLHTAVAARRGGRKVNNIASASATASRDDIFSAGGDLYHTAAVSSAPTGIQASASSASPHFNQNVRDVRRRYPLIGVAGRNQDGWACKFANSVKTARSGWARLSGVAFVTLYTWRAGVAFVSFYSGNSLGA